MGLTVQASDGAQLPLDSLPQNYYYTGANLTRIAVIFASILYFQDLEYDGDDVIFISRWYPADTSEAFTSTWKTDNAGTSNSNQITLPLVSTGTYDFYVNWGDGTFDRITAYNQAEITHTYPAAGTYTIEITGTCTGFRFNNGGDRLKLVNISQWGILQLVSVSGGGYFYGCSNLTITATDVLDISAITDMSNAFRSCAAITTIPSINSWDFSSVTTLASTFDGATLFNSPVGDWDISSVTTCANTFKGAAAFNQAVDTWDFSSVTTVAGMFWGASAFNQSLADIDTSSITTFAQMLRDAVAFNSSVDNFDLTSAITLGGMFHGATSFNQPLTGWINSDSVQILDVMFSGATAFDQNIGDLDVSSVISALNMFQGVTLSTANYNALLIGWAAQSVQTLVIFSGGNSKYAGVDAVAARATLTNAPNSWTITDGGTDANIFITVFDTEQGAPGSATISLPLVEDGTYDFTIDWGDGSVDDITAYDQAEVTHVYATPGEYTLTIGGTIEGWSFGVSGAAPKIVGLLAWGGVILGSPANQAGYFKNCAGLTITATDAPDLSTMISLQEMFYGCTSLTTVPNITGWDLSNVVKLASMFEGCTSFDQDINLLDVSNVTNFVKVFKGCTSFDQDLDGWDVAGAIDAHSMLEGCTSFNSSVSFWNFPYCLDLSAMFKGCVLFDQDFISPVTWDTPLCTTFESFLEGCSSFDQPLDGLNVESAVTLKKMLKGCSSFNHTLASWDVSNVENMDEMFSGAASFNYIVGVWLIPNLTSAVDMFDGVTLSVSSYNATLIGWAGQTVQPDVVFSGGNSQYDTGAPADARATLTDPPNDWIITDGGPA